MYCITVEVKVVEKVATLSFTFRAIISHKMMYLTFMYVLMSFIRCVTMQDIVGCGGFIKVGNVHLKLDVTQIKVRSVVSRQHRTIDSESDQTNSFYF